MNAEYWIPLVPSVLIEAGEVEQFFVEDHDLAVWRSRQGRIQIWDNRCPHRSVRLSLGQVQGERLVCAYHGWQFAAEDGHCQRIPAQPEQRAPKSLCTTTYAVTERAGMIWFGGSAGLKSEGMPQEIQSQVYAGSLSMTVTLPRLQECLCALGLTPRAEHAAGLLWQGHAADAALRIYLTPAQRSRVMIHALLRQDESPLTRHPLLNQIRQYLEQEQHSHV